MLRIAKERDLQIVASMATKFFQNTQYGHLDMDQEGLEALVKEFISPANRDKVCLLWEEGGVTVGCIAGQLVSVPFLGRMAAVECMWWVEPGHRGGPVGEDLLVAYEYWAKLQGADFMQMMCMADKTGKVLDRYYKRRGYSLTELTYTKEIV